MNQNTRKTVLLRIVRALPLLFTIISVLICVFIIGEISVKDILWYTPNNYLLAAICIIGFYVLKSLSIVFPIIVLYISAGSIFPYFWAVIVNILGIAACISVPYWIGYFSGHKFTKFLVKKYARVEKLNEFKHDNEWFFTFIVRLIGVLPCDIVSILMGSSKISYQKYILGSLAGMLPTMISATVVGVTITNPHSPAFIISSIFTILLSVVSILIYRKKSHPQLP